MLDVHGGVRIARGRMLRPSSGEAVVGRAVVDVFGGLPAELRFGRGLWKVVGVLESGGSAYESEIWVDAHDLAADGRRLLPYSSIRLRVAPGVDPEELSRRIETDARFGLTARIESDYYAEQADSASAFYAVIFALAGLGGLGAAMGATNALSASVMARRREIGTLRALGFPAGAVLRAFLSEALMLGLAGFAAGAVAVWAFAWAISDSLGGISFGSSAAIFVDLAVTPRDLFPGLALALLIGLCGGLLPAARAARLRPIDALERR